MVDKPAHSTIDSTEVNLHVCKEVQESIGFTNHLYWFGLFSHWEERALAEEKNRGWKL
mgnify:CR=1 FL=1